MRFVIFIIFYIHAATLTGQIDSSVLTLLKQDKRLSELNEHAMYLNNSNGTFFSSIKSKSKVFNDTVEFVLSVTKSRITGYFTVFLSDEDVALGDSTDFCLIEWTASVVNKDGEYFTDIIFYTLNSMGSNYQYPQPKMLIVDLASKDLIIPYYHLIYDRSHNAIDNLMIFKL